MRALALRGVLQVAIEVVDAPFARAAREGCGENGARGVPRGWCTYVGILSTIMTYNRKKYFTRRTQFARRKNLN